MVLESYCNKYYELVLLFLFVIMRSYRSDKNLYCCLVINGVTMNKYNLFYQAKRKYDP